MKNKYNYNYVYRITNKIEQKHYYGSRSSEIEAKLDLGIKYFSSSSDEDFREDQKNHPENYKYKIVRICSTKEKAIALEIKLQEKFNVGINESFYNKAIQTSTGFDRTDINHTLETKLKISESRKGVPLSPETKLKLSEAAKGVPKSPEHRQKLSEAKTGENHPMFGKEHSDETRQKMSEAHKNMSDETRKKMSEAHKGVPKSDEHKQKLSEANKGKEQTPETRQKISEAKLGVPQGPQEQVQCPHCGKIGGKSLMSRYHFDNCKYKEIEEYKEFKEEN
jgi:hypothetical protein